MGGFLLGLQEKESSESDFVDSMAFPNVPNLPKNQIRKAGDILIGKITGDIEWAHDILNKWRASHTYPINTFRSTLQANIDRINKKDGLVAQRLKRAPTIIDKLKRQPKMNLLTMQDIGGLRAIVDTIDNVRILEKIYKSKGRFKHELIDSYDYISKPKYDGYRSVHLVYKYKNDKEPQYNDLRLEVQIRTKLQHIWATAVETISILSKANYKTKRGSLDNDWSRFLATVSSAFAHLEKQSLVPGYENLSKDETFRLVAGLEKSFSFLNKMHGYVQAFKFIEGGKKEKNGKYESSYYHLITLDISKEEIYVKSFGRKESRRATEAYIEVEKRALAGENLDSVLVSAGPLKSLKKAYPNYFLDVADFIVRIKQIIKQVS